MPPPIPHSIEKRQALGAGETPNLLHLQMNTGNGVSFHFHVSTHLARLLSEALEGWLAADTAPPG